MESPNGAKLSDAPGRKGRGVRDRRRSPWRVRCSAVVRCCGYWLEGIELRLAGWREMPARGKRTKRVWLGGNEPYPCEHTYALLLLRAGRTLNAEAATRE